MLNNLFTIGNVHVTMTDQLKLTPEEASLIGSLKAIDVLLRLSDRNRSETWRKWAREFETDLKEVQGKSTHDDFIVGLAVILQLLLKIHAPSTNPDEIWATLSNQLDNLLSFGHTISWQYSRPCKVWLRESESECEVITTSDIDPEQLIKEGCRPAWGIDLLVIAEEEYDVAALIDPEVVASIVEAIIPVMVCHAYILTTSEEDQPMIEDLGAFQDFIDEFGLDTQE